MSDYTAKPKGPAFKPSQAGQHLTPKVIAVRACPTCRRQTYQTSTFEGGPNGCLWAGCRSNTMKAT